MLLGLPAAANDLAPQVLFILSARQTIGVSLLAGFAFGLALGTTLGLHVAAHVLRAANTAAMQYHRAQVAAILDASSVVHTLVSDIVERAHDRIARLREALHRLRETQP